MSNNDDKLDGYVHRWVRKSEMTPDQIEYGKSMGFDQDALIENALKLCDATHFHAVLQPENTPDGNNANGTDGTVDGSDDTNIGGNVVSQSVETDKKISIPSAEEPLYTVSYDVFKRPEFQNFFLGPDQYFDPEDLAMLKFLAEQKPGSSE
uniref:UBA domain-containing protein n=1 Tax=Panagrellus redivivus TaxID=6233 RepID=A0A7E4VCS3_PANRE